MGWWLRGYYVTRVWLELICASIWWLSLERKCEIEERWGEKNVDLWREKKNT